jgi:hypothetical protein
MYSVGYLFMASSPTPERAVPYSLLGMTAVTGLVDAVSFLSLGLAKCAGGQCKVTPDMAPTTQELAVRQAVRAS